MEPSLHESKILITRGAKQAKALSDKVIALGGIPIEVPLLRISCKEEAENSQILHNLHRYKWIFFTSSNGVDCFIQLMEKYHLENLQDIKFAAVGHKTEQALKDYGYVPSFIPSIYNADVMAAEFLKDFKDEGPVLLIRGNRSRDVLPTEFSKHELSFDVLEVYETSFNYDAKDQLNELLKKNEIDFITFTSPSTVEAFVEMAEVIPEKHYVCIGTTTEQRALEFGFKSLITPQEFTTDSMLQAISNYINRKEG
ncbi:uroporphyrinogen-III synthase [Oceanobacillus saliphilus]|uniref:uroporphyrinogen-III synthase n=1 Tax=Oceanobacillus saliphilus TaxID=2925834 RepID=UPI00201DDD95|nr:uroporphyrinogen-III synthase [Oceanobacillus saliphilus]